MKILHTLPRHSMQLAMLTDYVERNQRDTRGFDNMKYVCIVVDGPESLNRSASWSSDFNDEDTHKIIQALADQTRP